MANAVKRSSEIESANPNSGFWGYLAAGNFGLATTYWLFGVVVAILYMLLADYVLYGVAFWVVSVPYVFYWVAVSIGIWNAAGKYRGSPLWALLARLAVLFSFWSFARELYLLLI